MLFYSNILFYICFDIDQLNFSYNSHTVSSYIISTVFIINNIYMKNIHKTLAACAAWTIAVASISSVSALDTMVWITADITADISVETSWAKFLAKNNIIVDQWSDTSKYQLTSDITRREMLKVMMNISWKTVVDRCEWKFNDLDSSDWGCKYAEAALIEWYIAANASFRPDDKVSEAESLKMVMQARWISRDANDDWKKWYESKAMSEGIITSKLNLDNNAQRGWIFSSAALTFDGFKSMQKSKMTSEENMMMSDQMMEDSMAPSDDMMSETGTMVGWAMMVQSKNIVENAVEADNLTTVVAAVKAAGLVETLSWTGPFTVFAPTNTAFAKLPVWTVDTLLLAESKATLAWILTYHVVAGSYLSTDITDWLELTTVQWNTIKFAVDAQGTVTINWGAMIETADIKSSNWISHVIDTVLMPSDQ